MKYVSYLQFLDTIPEEARKLYLTEAIEIIKLYQESTGDTCRLDHHGYCQEHWLDKEEDCPNFRANKLLKSLE